MNAIRRSVCGTVYTDKSGKESAKQDAWVHVMNTDRRRSIRKRLKLNVDIYGLHEYLGFYQTRDLALDGAYIDICDSDLYPDDLLELHFHVQDGERPFLRLRAVVTRSSNKGIAVKFKYGDEDYRRLLNIFSTYASDGHMRRVPGFWYVDKSVN